MCFPEQGFLKLGPSRCGKTVMPISTTLLFHSLDFYPSVNTLGPKLCSQPTRLLDFGDSQSPLVLDPSARVVLHQGLDPRNLDAKLSLNGPYLTIELELKYYKFANQNTCFLDLGPPRCVKKVMPHQGRFLFSYLGSKLV